MRSAPHADVADLLAPIPAPHRPVPCSSYVGEARPLPASLPWCDMHQRAGDLRAAEHDAEPLEHGADAPGERRREQAPGRVAPSTSPSCSTRQPRALTKAGRKGEAPPKAAYIAAYSSIHRRSAVDRTASHMVRSAPRGETAARRSVAGRSEPLERDQVAWVSRGTSYHQRH
jgi:hypothetical protein